MSLFISHHYIPCNVNFPGVADGIHISGATHKFVAHDQQFKWREEIVDVKGKGAVGQTLMVADWPEMSSHRQGTRLRDAETLWHADDKCTSWCF